MEIGGGSRKAKDAVVLEMVGDTVTTIGLSGHTKTPFRVLSKKAVQGTPPQDHIHSATLPGSPSVARYSLLLLQQQQQFLPPLQAAQNIQLVNRHRTLIMGIIYFYWLLA